MRLHRSAFSRSLCLRCADPLRLCVPDNIRAVYALNRGSALVHKSLFDHGIILFDHQRVSSSRRSSAYGRLPAGASAARMVTRKPFEARAKK